jgi:hypothetical protein
VTKSQGCAWRRGCRASRRRPPPSARRTGASARRAPP